MILDLSWHSNRMKLGMKYFAFEREINHWKPEDG